jgi:hypothetical protein
LAASILSPTYEECAANYQQQTADPEKSNPSPTPNRSLTEKAKVFFHCEGEFLHSNSEAIIAIFTIVLAFSTIFLWIATSDVVSSAEKTSREQLAHGREINRAYLAGGGDFDKTTRIFKLDVENNGKTPAFMLAYDVQTALPGQIGMQRALPVNPDHQHWEDTISPWGRKSIETRIIVANNVASIFGCVWYRDVWGDPHHSRFILSVRQNRTWPDVTGVHDDYTECT